MRKQLVVAACVVAALAGAALLLNSWSGERGLLDRARRGGASEQVRAVDGLARTRSKGAAKAVVSLVDHKDAQVAAKAVIALGRIGRPEYLDTVRRAARDSRQDVRAAAYEAMSGFGQKADVPMLLAGLTDAQNAEKVQAAAAESIGRLEAIEGMPALMDALDNASALVRARAGVAIQRIYQMDMGFRASDPPEQRRIAVERIRRYYPYAQVEHAEYVKRMNQNKAAGK